MTQNKFAITVRELLLHLKLNIFRNVSLNGKAKVKTHYMLWILTVLSPPGQQETKNICVCFGVDWAGFPFN